MACQPEARGRWGAPPAGTRSRVDALRLARQRLFEVHRPGLPDGTPRQATDPAESCSQKFSLLTCLEGTSWPVSPLSLMEEFLATGVLREGPQCGRATGGSGSGSGARCGATRTTTGRLCLARAVGSRVLPPLGSSRSLTPTPDTRDRHAGEGSAAAPAGSARTPRRPGVRHPGGGKDDKDSRGEGAVPAGRLSRAWGSPFPGAGWPPPPLRGRARARLHCAPLCRTGVRPHALGRRVEALGGVGRSTR